MRIVIAHTVVVVVAAVLACSACAAKSSEVAMHEGIVAHNRGELSLAKARYQRALKLEPGIQGAQTNLGALAFARGELEVALREIQGELERRPEDPSARLLRALTFVATGRYQKAEEDAEGLAALGGGLAAQTVAGKTRRATARLTVALARLAKAGDARGGDAVQAIWDALDPILHLKVASIQRRSGGASLDTLVRIQRHARRVGGLLALTSGSYQRGLDLLAADATSKRPAPYPVHRLHALVALGRVDDALALVASAKAGPLRDSAWAKVLRGHALLAKQRPAEIHKVVGGIPSSTSLPTPVRVAALRLLAVAAAAKHRWQRALDVISAAENLLGRGNVPASLWLDKATAQAHLGEVEDARRTISGVLRDDPTDERAKSLEALLR